MAVRPPPPRSALSQLQNRAGHPDAAKQRD